MTVTSSKSMMGAALGALILASTAAAQGGGGGGGAPGGNQAPPENLQVLPKDMARPQVVAIMQQFRNALGVQCAFCHTEREGTGPGQVAASATPPAAAPAGGPPAGRGGGGGGGGGAPGGAGPGGGGPPQVPLNYALDNKDQKKTARVMLKMVDSINKMLAAVPTRDMSMPIAVNCYTCHRGVSKPMTIDAVIANAIEKGGVDSAIARYRALRTDVAAGRYNFTEAPVTLAAQRLAAAGKHDDALKLLQMNLEYNPTSPNLDFEIANAMVNKGDKDAGIARLRAILVKNPNDRRARALLTQLGATPAP